MWLSSFVSQETKWLSDFRLNMSFLQPRSFCCRDLCSVAKAASSEPPSLHKQWEKPPQFAPCQAPVLAGSCSQAPFGKLWRLGWVFLCLFKVVWMPEGWKSQARRCGIVKPCWVLTHPLSPLPMNHGLQKSSTESEEGRPKVWSASFHSSDYIWITHVRLNLCFIPDEQSLVTGRVSEN